jgi:uncharacterized membrane protein YcaP (DUF421 family)
LSDVLWVSWEYHNHASALLILQIALAAMNIRGEMEVAPREHASLESADMQGVVMNLFELSMPWYEFALRGGVAYILLLIMLRFTGKHSLGQMSPFEMIVLVLIGGTLRSAIVGDDRSLIGPFIAVATILSLDQSIAWLSSRWVFFNRIVEGKANELAKDGLLIPGALQRHDIPKEAFARELRENGLSDIAEVKAALLEPNGRISVIKRNQ